MTGTLQSLKNNTLVSTKMEIAMIKLKNIKYLCIVEKLRGITATLNEHHQEISENYVVCRQLVVFFTSLSSEKGKI